MISALKMRLAAPVLFVSMGTFLFLPHAFAQHGARTAPATALPPDARAIIGRLSSLGNLPEGFWKMHPGDVPHGESVDLDDSAWQAAARGAKLSDQAVWFRQTVQIPETLDGYDLTGARIWFQFHAAPERSVTQIVYFNGRRVALGEDLEPVVLFDNAKPGDKAVVAVKLLNTYQPKSFHGATLAIELPGSRPNPLDLAQQFRSVALLLPGLAPADASKEAVLESAIHAVDLAALDAAETSDAEARAAAQAKFDSSLRDAQAKLEPLQPLLRQLTFHLTGNSHIDAAWLWPRSEAEDVVRRTFGTALQLMYEYPAYTYTQSAAQYNEWLAEKYPAMNDEIKQRIKQGRWEVVGGMWVEPDLNMPDGESLVRQLLVGKRWYLQHYGVDVRVGWNPDSFGYTWQLPQIYKKSGVDFFVTQKMAWSDTNHLPFKLFWWESPDGSKVLTYFPHDYANEDMSPTRLSRDMATARVFSPGLTNMMDLYGVGDHGGGPTRAMLDQAMHWATPSMPAHVVPNYLFGTAISFFDNVDKDIAPQSPVWNYQSIAKGYTPPPAVPGKISIPTWDSELYLEFHRGVYTTQAHQKRNMRTAEEEVLDTEKWASLAWLDGNKYPGDRLTVDWEKVLFNQFHDLAAGSGIGIIYKDAQKDYDWVRMSTNAISASSLQTVSEHIDTQTKAAGRVPIIVFNPLAWQRSGDVTVNVQLPVANSPDAYRVLGQTGDAYHSVATVLKRDPVTGEVTLNIPVSNVPALGYKTIWIDYAPGTTPALPKGTESDTGSSFTLENANLRVVIDKSTGCIASLYDKRGGFETFAANSCGNELEAFADHPKEYDAWNIGTDRYKETPALLTEVDSIAAVGSSAVRIARTWQSSKFVQTISLAPDADYVNVNNQIDWHERHTLLKAAFTLAAASPFATYEIPYGTIERPTTRNNSWEDAKFEVSAIRWADLAGTGPGGKPQGFSLINRTKYGYDAVGNLLRLTLLRSPTSPDPNADQGEHHFQYALYPHAGTWKTALTERHGFEYDYRLLALAATEHAGPLPADHSFVSVTPDNVILTAVKKAEDAKGLILRVYEWAGKNSTVEFHVPPGSTGATVTNLMETPQGDPLPIANNTVRVPIHPYEILTVRVNYPDGGPQ
ncbi:MAG: glycoside hydrolase family 38 C-terminal domain-containing protein [Terracidiphilus sp.]